MLAYRHGFHAGMHADVLKHVVLMQVLLQMGQKDKAYTFVDTHAGAGGYSLEGDFAHKTGEYLSGIARLWDRADLPPALADYVGLVRAFGNEKRLTQYPGSPGVANQLLRPQDHLHLYELHPTDERILRGFLSARPNTTITLGDGFAAVAKELPPRSRRGVLLIDPSYEMKTDYARTLGAVREALTQFAQAVVLVWVPQVALVEARELPRRLGNAAASAPKGWLHAGLTVARGRAKGFGLTGSSMVVINPPHGLAETLRKVLPFLAQALAQFEGATHRLDTHEK
jgi:23S rRNA (adenine2030-N6)-methyltransferase